MDGKTDFIIYTSKQKAKIIKQTLKNSKAREIVSELSKVLKPVYLGFREESCVCASTMTSTVADRGRKCFSGNGATNLVFIRKGRKVHYLTQ